MSKKTSAPMELPLTGNLAKAETSPSADNQPTVVVLDPAWDAVREVAAQILHLGRLSLRGQVRLGMLLAHLKREHGRPEGRPRKNSPESREFLSWPDLVKRETGYSRQSADEFIRFFEAAKAKLKKSKKLDLPAPAKKDALVLFQAENPLALSDEQWQLVDVVIASLTCGETQASLMIELGILPKPKAMPTSAGGGKPKDDCSAEQLAFHFFEAAIQPLFQARTSPDYKKLLHVLPVYSTQDKPLSLDTIATECRAILADIAEVQQAACKPAKGKVIG